MIITDQTTTWDIAELMGSEADEIDGRIMLSLISRESESDTDAIPAARWQELLDESQEIRRRESEEDA